MGSRAQIKNLMQILEDDDEFAQFTVDRLIYNLVSSVPKNSKLAFDICSSFEDAFDDDMDAVGIKFPHKKAKDKKYYSGTASGRRVVKEDWNAILEYTKRQVEFEGAPQEGEAQKNIRQLGEYLNLTDIETECLILIHTFKRVDRTYHNFITNLVKGDASRLPAFFALAMDRPNQVKNIAQAISIKGKLLEHGLVEFEHSGIDEISVPLLEENIRDHVESSDFNVTRLVEEIIGLPIKSDLTIADNFPHMEKQVEKIIKALKYAAKHKIKGVNVLLHGPIGSGKTELARAMLVEAGLKGYAVGEDEDSNIQYGGMGTKIDSSKRLFRLKQAQRFLADTDDSGCVIDEIEDLLIKGEDSSKSADSSSKILLNRALEDNNVPTIWIGNDLGKFHESFRQRFKFPLFVGYQPTLVREKIWNHHITKNNLKLGRGASLKLARMFESPPRVISQACETAELIGGSFDDVIHQVQDKATIDFNGDRSGYNAQYPVPSRYRLSLLNSDSDLKQLKDDVVQASNDLKPLTVLVEGDRKVGKSTLAYYFAECAQMHIVEYDVQMLKTPTQQTEPVDHISMIFANAAKTNAILVIDGMEALFTGIETRDKDGMIERFMDCLETHTAPVILTQSSETQMSQEFRRFIDYTVTLDKIDGKQLVSAFKSYTGKRPTKSAQTPTAIGDIARAARSAKAMGGERGIIERRIAASATVASTIKAGIGIK